MPRIDFGHLYKFVASTGLALIAAAFAVPWLYGQSIAVLSIPREDLKGLTATARQVIVQRQDAIAAVQEWILIGAGLALVLGLALLGWGLFQWRRRQSIQDQNENADLRKKLAELEPASQSEIDLKREMEITDANEPDPGGATTPMQPARTDESTAQRSSSGSTFTSRMEVIRQTESRLVELLQAGFSSGFAVLPSVSVEGPFGLRSVLDAVINPPEDSQWAQVGLDIRRASLPTLQARIPEAMVRMAVATREFRVGSVYTGQRGRPPVAEANALVVLVLEARDTASGRAMERARALVASVNTVLTRSVGVIVVDSDRFDTMTASELRTAIAQASSAPMLVQHLVGD